jgi:hypothetical protein
MAHSATHTIVMWLHALTDPLVAQTHSSTCRCMHPRYCISQLQRPVPLTLVSKLAAVLRTSCEAQLLKHCWVPMPHSAASATGGANAQAGIRYVCCRVH